MEARRPMQSTEGGDRYVVNVLKNFILNTRCVESDEKGGVTLK